METKKSNFHEVKPKELIKPLKTEELLQEEKVLEALCETRDHCDSDNWSIGHNDDILF